MWSRLEVEVREGGLGWGGAIELKLLLGLAEGLRRWNRWRRKSFFVSFERFAGDMYIQVSGEVIYFNARTILAVRSLGA